MSDSAIAFGGELPASWTIATIQEVAEIGPKPDTSDVADEQSVHFVPMAAVAEDFGGLDASQLRPFREVRKGYTAFAEGDVLFAKITPCMENGKGAIVPALPHTYAFGSTEFHVLRPGASISDKWLAHFLSQPDFRRVARQNMTGTAGQLRVPAKWLASAGVPIPPLAEQARIVQKLEELLSELDAGVAELKTAQRKLVQYRQSLLKAAVEGALTADWRAAHDALQETGTELLQRILSKRRSDWEEGQLVRFAEQAKTPPKDLKARYPVPVPANSSGLPVLPRGWAWASLDQLGDVITGFTPKTSNRAFFGGDIPFFKPTDLDAGYDLREYRESLTTHGAEQGRLLPRKSVLVTCIGATIGKTALARTICATNQQINALSVVESHVLPEFVYFVLTSNFGQNKIKSSASATTLPILNKSKFSKLPIPLPGKSEQARIVEILEVQVAAVRAHEEAIELSLRQIGAQRKNILKAAFSGQLVPQDPNDEPASDLLARIRASREAKGGSSTASKRGRKAKGAA